MVEKPTMGLLLAMGLLFLMTLVAESKPLSRQSCESDECKFSEWCTEQPKLACAGMQESFFWIL